MAYRIEYEGSGSSEFVNIFATDRRVVPLTVGGHVAIKTERESEYQI